MRYTICECRQFSLESVLRMYEAVGWTNYTGRPDMVECAWRNSLLILCAYEQEQLVGFLRAVGDGASIVFVQDIVVDPAHQRQGIGTKLVYVLMERYRDVYQMELMTDDSEKTVAFYQSLGFVKASDYGCCAFMKL